MPLFERFAPGTEWVLTVPFGSWPAGLRVRIEEGPGQTQYEDEIIVKVTPIDGPDYTFDVAIDILG